MQFVAPAYNLARTQQIQPVPVNGMYKFRARLTGYKVPTSTTGTQQFIVVEISQAVIY
jgi:hypothetical protein